ncbi:hypothetical protein GJ496_008015 [Pomphorhynchus laevis]|nr:hypothetical protein GJ496_008015 [Pomphorhynchus laevis]
MILAGDFNLAYTTYVSCPANEFTEFLLYFGINLRSFPNQWTYASHNSSPMRKHKPVIVEATLSCISTECRQSKNYVSFTRHVNCDLISEKDINKAFVNLQHGFVEQSYETILNSLLDATIPCRPDNRNPRPPRSPILCELRSELVQIHIGAVKQIWLNMQHLRRIITNKFVNIFKNFTLDKRIIGLRLRKNFNGSLILTVMRSWRLYSGFPSLVPISVPIGVLIAIPICVPISVTINVSIICVRIGVLVAVHIGILTGVPISEPIGVPIAVPIASQKLPEDWNNGQVKTLVQSNIISVSHDPLKAVLVEFYAPWCGICQRLESVYNLLGTHFENHSDVFVAKIDATLHEIPSIPIAASQQLCYSKR